MKSPHTISGRKVSLSLCRRYWSASQLGGRRIRKWSILVAIAVNEDDYREVFGTAEGIKEDKASWVNFFQRLKGRHGWGQSHCLHIAAGKFLEICCYIFSWFYRRRSQQLTVIVVRTQDERLDVRLSVWNSFIRIISEFPALIIVSNRTTIITQHHFARRSIRPCAVFADMRDFLIK